MKSRHYYMDNDKIIEYGAYLAVAIIVTPIVVAQLVKGYLGTGSWIVDLLSIAMGFVATTIIKLLLSKEYSDVSRTTVGFIGSLSVCIFMLYTMKDALMFPAFTIVSTIVMSILSYIWGDKIFTYIKNQF